MKQTCNQVAKHRETLKRECLNGSDAIPRTPENRYQARYHKWFTTHPIIVNIND